MTNAIWLKNNRCLPLMIPSMHAKYETNMSRTFWVIASHQKCWQTDGQTDRQTERRTENVITIGLLHFQCRALTRWLVFYINNIMLIVKSEDFLLNVIQNFAILYTVVECVDLLNNACQGYTMIKKITLRK